MESDVGEEGARSAARTADKNTVIKVQAPTGVLQVIKDPTPPFDEALTDHAPAL